MKLVNPIKSSIILLTAATITGCATTGLEGSGAPQLVQAVQIGDDALACDELQVRIQRSDRAVAQLKESIDSSKTVARTNDAAGAINSYLGKSSIFSNMAASFARNSVEDMREVRTSHQRRRDILLQQYMHKQCALTAQN